MTASTACFATRGAAAGAYHLITPANHAVSRLPELLGARVIKLITPRRAPAAFAQYLLELAPGGGTSGAPVAIDTGFEHAFYGLDGAAVISAGELAHELGAGRFAFVPPGLPIRLQSDSGPARLLWFKRRYWTRAGLSEPAPVLGDRAELTEALYAPGLYRTPLFGEDDPRFDFGLIWMRFEPGADLAMTELHEEEHGLYMTAGRGRYLLGAEVHEVSEGDFVYMAPYCPQSFVADPVVGAEYILYKDLWRDGFAPPECGRPVTTGQRSRR